MNIARRSPLRAAFGRIGMAMAVAGLCFPLSAGDKLNITGSKIRIQPGAEQETGAAKIKNSRTLVSPSPFDGSAPQTTPRRQARDVKLQKKMQNERNERENWALLAPGELQEAEGEEYDFGVREYSLDGLEKKEQVRDYTFYGLDESPAQDRSRRAGSNGRSENPQTYQNGSRFTGQKPLVTRRADDEYERFNRNDSPNPLRLNRSPGGKPPVGAHMAPELDLKGMLQPTESQLGLHNTPGSSDTSLRSLLGESIPAPGQPDQQQRMDNFRQMLNTGLPGTGSLSDPLSYTADKTRQPLNPVLPVPANPPQEQTLAVPSPATPGFPSQFGPMRVPGFPQAEGPPSRVVYPMQEPPRRKF